MSASPWSSANLDRDVRELAELLAEQHKLELLLEDVRRRIRRAAERRRA